MNGDPSGSRSGSRPRRTTAIAPLGRRALLRGAGRVAIALPFLDAMSPRRAFAQAAGRTEPKRLFTFLIENGVVPSAWFPTGSEKEFKMGSILNPMLPYQKHVIMPDGLDNKTSGGTCHAVGRAGALTGQNNSGGRANGISIDQAVANHISTGTRLKSIEASVFLKTNFIYSLFHSGPREAIFPEDDPAKVFERLFSPGVPTPVTPGNPSPTVNEDFGRLRLRKKSILDRAMEEYKRLHGTVGGTDKIPARPAHERHPGDRARAGGPRRGGQRGGGQRELQAAAGAGGRHLRLPDAHEAALGAAVDGARLRHHPGGVDPDARLADLLHLAGGQRRPARHLAPAGQPGPDGQLNKIATWFCEQVVYIIQQLQSYPTGDGKTLFDNTLLFWANDLGTGPHSRKRYPFLLATGDFTLPDGKLLETGRYLKYPGGTAHNDLLTSVGRIMGLPITNFGNHGKGPLPGLG